MKFFYNLFRQRVTDFAVFSGYDVAVFLKDYRNFLEKNPTHKVISTTMLDGRTLLVTYTKLK